MPKFYKTKSAAQRGAAALRKLFKRPYKAVKYPGRKGFRVVSGR